MEYVINRKVEYVIRGVEYVINRKSGVRNQRGGVRNKSKSGVRNQRGGVRKKKVEYVMGVREKKNTIFHTLVMPISTLENFLEGFEKTFHQKIHIF